MKAAGFEFVPIVSEVFGRWGPATSQFLRNLLLPAQLIGKAVYSKVLASWWRRLSCSPLGASAKMPHQLAGFGPWSTGPRHGTWPAGS